jgi:hypothetical protein
MALPILPILIVGGIALMTMGRKKKPSNGMDDPYVPCASDSGPPGAPNYRYGTGGGEGGQSCGSCVHIGQRTIKDMAIYWCEKYGGSTGGMCMCDSYEGEGYDWETALLQEQSAIQDVAPGRTLTRVDHGVEMSKGGGIPCHWMVAAIQPPADRGDYLVIIRCPADDLAYTIWFYTVTEALAQAVELAKE